MKPGILIRSIGLACAVSIALLLPASPRHPEANGQTSLPSALARARSAFEQFIQKPSWFTASVFYFSISSGQETDGVKAGILDHIFQRSRHQIYLSIIPFKTIAIEMLQGNIFAARAAIRLLEFVDTGSWRTQSERTRVAGWIGGSLGEMVRVDPALFLRACSEERENPYLKEKGFPVVFIPAIMKKRTTRVLYELEMRRKALWSVEDPELRPIRDECIKVIDREIKMAGSEGSGSRELERKSFEDPGAEIASVFAEMQNRPDSVSMKRVLSLFSEVPIENFADLLEAIDPSTETSRSDAESPLEIIRREARCCNEYAIEVLFRAFIHFIGYQGLVMQEELSNLILIRPRLFIEKLAKYIDILDGVEADGRPAIHNFQWICTSIGSSYFWDTCDINIILRRRIDALAALNMPEHKELIDRCIRSIEKELTAKKGISNQTIYR